MKKPAKKTKTKTKARWINCNLPFADYSFPSTPDFPDMSEEERAHFGETKKEWEAKQMAYVDRDRIREEFEDPIREKLKKKPNYSVELLFAEIRKLAKKASRAKAKLINRYCDEWDRYYEYEEWLAKQPKYIEWQAAYDKALDAHNEQKPKTFSSMGLVRPGVLIEVENGGETSQYLIGDINTNRGVCDDCTAFGDDAIVKRYKVIWKARKTA